MPHILLEYSQNVPAVPALGAFFADLHRALAATEACSMVDLKSRAICHADYLVGDGKAGGANAFVALSIKLLEGRDVSVRQRLLQASAEVVAQHFAAARQSGRCQVSVCIDEMARATYTKQWPERSPAPGERP